MKTATQAIRKQFGGQRRLRQWRNTHFGGMEAVKAHPLAICAFRPDEGGTVSTSLNVSLAPVSGYMRTKAYVDVVQVFVPYQAIEALELDAQDDAGVTEMTRRRLLAGSGIGLEDEGTITKAANIHPRSVGGAKKVSKTARLAYMAAVNHLRLTAYFKAALVDKTETAILPALLSANVLERFNGVLEPETLIDGAVNMTGELPVKGIGVASADVHGAIGATKTAEGTEAAGDGYYTNATSGNQFQIVSDSSGVPQIKASMAGAGEVTLRDLVQSQMLDRMVRAFAQVVKDDPINGEAAVERALFSLQVDYDKNCHVMYRRVYELSPAHTRPMDGASFNDVSANFELNDRFATVVPRSELGGQLVTLAMVKPVEVIEAQPDPAQTQAWELVNRVLDETELDEVLLTRADLESDVASADEDTPAFWVGHNQLAHDYGTQGANAQQTFEVEMRSSMWLYELPSSVTPENINYPSGGISMYPFYNWTGAHAEYTISQVAAISTSLARGPNPVEKIELFADDPSLVAI